MGVEYGGERPPANEEPRFSGRQIPAHLSAPKPQCVYHPGRTLVRLSETGREVYTEDGRWSCSDPLHHDHGASFDGDASEETRAEWGPAWLPLPFR